MVSTKNRPAIDELDMPVIEERNRWKGPNDDDDDDDDDDIPLLGHDRFLFAIQQPSYYSTNVTDSPSYMQCVLLKLI
jgi:hypothetical protein